MTADDGLDWKAWRKERRAALIAARRAMNPDDRAVRNTAIDEWLEAGFAAFGGLTVGFCWPFAGEPEPRFAIRRWRDRGSRAALPAVVAPGQPLEFREWWPGAPMERGVYGIPFPVGTDIVVPDAAVVPVNGFDAEGYRLGYGGGYFDRTLAALPWKPVCIGLAYENQRLDTIHPQPHDIPFDFIVTEAAIHARNGGRLMPVPATDADNRVRALLAQRGIGA